MSRKSCPRCGHRITLGRFLRLTSHRVVCRQCGAELHSRPERFVLALAIMAVPLGFVVAEALRNPVWWLGVVATLALSVLVCYWLFEVRAAPGTWVEERVDRQS
ncbi:MAG TPA: hypothetical protein VKA86_14180 [Candidatus Krumholzibacteria bacterium]|nr:hypothetical protein [Candidatus Krumholzibacteria bacterium]